MRDIRKRDRIFLVLREPKRFMEIMRETGLSDVGLMKALKDLQEKSLVAKLPDGRYALTEKGRRLAEELEVYELVEEAVAVAGVERVKKLLEDFLSLF